MVRLDDLDLLLGVSHLVDDVVLDFSSVCCKVIVQELVLLRSVEFGVRKILVQLLQ